MLVGRDKNVVVLIEFPFALCTFVASVTLKRMRALCVNKKITCGGVYYKYDIYFWLVEYLNSFVKLLTILCNLNKTYKNLYKNIIKLEKSCFVYF